MLGLASYGCGFAVSGGGAAAWSVRFAALAGLVAVLDLWLKRESHAFGCATLAAMGFLEGLSSVATAQAGWPQIVIVVANFGQAAAAIAALLLWPNAGASTAATGYEAYLDYYNQAVRQYYSQHYGQQGSSAPPPSVQRGGYGQASYAAQAAPPAQRQRRPSQRGDYPDLGDTGYAGAASPRGEYGDSPSAAGSSARPGQSVPPAGLPTVGPAHTAAGQSEEHPDPARRPSSPP